MPGKTEENMDSLTVIPLFAPKRKAAVIKCKIKSMAQ
jgi:hypothetical protein